MFTQIVSASGVGVTPGNISHLSRWCSITSKATKIMKPFHDDKKIIAHIFISCLAIAMLLILSVHPAIADYNFDGFPETDELEEAEQGTVKGGVYIDGGHGVSFSPYTQSFNVPEGNVTWARLYVGIWGGNEENTGSVAVTFNSEELGGALDLKGEVDTNPNVYCSGHGVYWIYYAVTDNTTSGPVDAVVTTSGDIDGRVYGVVLVAVYEESDGEKVEYWINEGNVNLHGPGWYGEFGTNDEALADFAGTVDVDKFAMARLTVVYLTGTPGLNDYLYFNDEKLCEEDNCDDIANSKQSFDIKTFDVTEYLDQKTNIAEFKMGDEDYLHPVLAVLTLHSELKIISAFSTPLGLDKKGILNDNSRPRHAGDNETKITAEVVDIGIGIQSVTLDLSAIGGSAQTLMSGPYPNPGTYEVTTTATAGINGTHAFVITATDNGGNTTTAQTNELIVYRRGDVMRNNVVDMGDALYIARYTVGLETPDMDYFNFVGDVQPASDGDHTTNMGDALYIARHTVNLEVAP